MRFWFHHKNKIEQLQENYIRLMKKSYEKSLNNKVESEAAHAKASEVLKELNLLIQKERTVS